MAFERSAVNITVSTSGDNASPRYLRQLTPLKHSSLTNIIPDNGPRRTQGAFIFALFSSPRIPALTWRIRGLAFRPLLAQTALNLSGQRKATCHAGLDDWTIRKSWHESRPRQHAAPLIKPQCHCLVFAPASNSLPYRRLAFLPRTPSSSPTVTAMTHSIYALRFV